jgi:hypothetical protein
VLPYVKPAPGSDPVDIRPLANPQTASFELGESDRFTLRRWLAWGDRRLPPGSTVELRLVNTGRYARDLGLILRPVHTGLVGWDTVALPPLGSMVGMTREALLDFLHGSQPFPPPKVEVQWLGPTRVGLSIHNDTPHQSGMGTVGNWVELRFAGTDVLDVQLGGFSGMEWGASNGGRFKAVHAPRDANALRFHYLFLPPHDFVGGAVVSFVSRPRELRTRWGVLPGDGRALTGRWVSVPTAGR